MCYGSIASVDTIVTHTTLFHCQTYCRTLFWAAILYGKLKVELAAACNRAHYEHQISGVFVSWFCMISLQVNLYSMLCSPLKCWWTQGSKVCVYERVSGVTLWCQLEKRKCGKSLRRGWTWAQVLSQTQGAAALNAILTVLCFPFFTLPGKAQLTNDIWLHCSFYLPLTQSKFLTVTLQIFFLIVSVQLFFFLSLSLQGSHMYKENKDCIHLQSLLNKHHRWTEPLS